MELHINGKCFQTRNGDNGVAWCDEGILIINPDRENTDLLIDNRKIYFGTAKLTEDDKLMFVHYKVVEE